MWRLRGSSNLQLLRGTNVHGQKWTIFRGRPSPVGARRPRRSMPTSCGDGGGWCHRRGRRRRRGRGRGTCSARGGHAPREREVKEAENGNAGQASQARPQQVRKKEGRKGSPHSHLVSQQHAQHSTRSTQWQWLWRCDSHSKGLQQQLCYKRLLFRLAQ